MEDCKPWWASKAIWTGVIGSMWGAAAALGILPEGLTQADVLAVVLALTGIGCVVFRMTAKARIGQNSTTGMGGGVLFSASSHSA